MKTSFAFTALLAATTGSAAVLRGAQDSDYTICTREAQIAGSDCILDPPQQVRQVVDFGVPQTGRLLWGSQVVGASTTITCPNGENVSCNSGTDGCIDNSPTLCKDKQANDIRTPAAKYFAHHDGGYIPSAADLKNTQRCFHVCEDNQSHWTSKQFDTCMHGCAISDGREAPSLNGRAGVQDESSNVHVNQCKLIIAGSCLYPKSSPQYAGGCTKTSQNGVEAPAGLYFC